METLDDDVVVAGHDDGEVKHELVVNYSVKLRPSLGMVDGKTLLFLGQAPPCKGSACPVIVSCQYRSAKAKREVGRGKCTMIHNLVRELYDTWVHPTNGIGDVLTQPQLHKIGVHLMPLYIQYMRLFIEITGLRDSSYKDVKGNFHVYPQYKAFQDAERAIRSIEASLGLDEIWAKKFNTPMPDMAGIMEAEVSQKVTSRKKGLPGAYESLLGKDE